MDDSTFMAMSAEIERLEDAISATSAENLSLQSRVKELECHNEALLEKQIAETCACSHDNATDVCLGHSPMLKKAIRERYQADQDARVYRNLYRHALNPDLEPTLADIKRDIAYELAAKWPPTSVMHSRLKELGDQYVEKKERA